MESRFSNLKRGIVKSGVKVTSSSTPEIVADSTYNKFTINAPARDLMDIKKGERLIFIDLMGDATNMNDRFFVAKGYQNGDKQEGYKIGETYSFNCSGPYSAIINGDFEVKSLKQRELVESGLIIEREHVSEKTGKPFTSYVSTKKVFMQLEAINDGEEVPYAETEAGEEIVGKVWALTGFNYVDHTPKGGEDEEYEDKVGSGDDDDFDDDEEVDA